MDDRNEVSRVSAVVETRAECVNPEQLDALRSFAEGLSEGELRELLLALSTSLSSGVDLAVLDQSSEFTPSQAASRLRMSRTHLYKLLDSGMIPFHHVGRDRRISGRDLVTFERQRQMERRALAERLARPAEVRTAAEEELAELL